LSPSTIRNIEHDEHYNVSLDLLRNIAEVLGATVRVTLEIPEVPETAAVSSETSGRKVVTNDYFIRLIHERHPECPLTNSQIGRRMWQFAKSRGAELVKERKQIARSPASSVANYRVPTTAAQYAVRERDLAAMERFADRLGRAFRDEKGRVLVPIK
jgi:hypothetical protein